MKLPSRQFLLVVVLVLASHLVSAQQQPYIPPFQSWSGGPFDVVNLGNLDIHFTIPILHKAGRGQPFAYDISYDGAQVWSPAAINGTSQWQPGSAFGWFNTSGAGMGGYVSYSTTTSSGQCPINPPYTFGTYTQIEYYGFVYHDSAGFTYQMGGTAYYITTTGCTSPPNGPSPTTPEKTVANDGSGYTMYVGPATANSIPGYIVAKSGTIINVPFVSGPPVGGSGPIQDQNGNMISESGGTWTDTLGTQVLAIVGTPPANTTLTYTAPSGANAVYTIGYTNYTVRTWFQVQNISEYGPQLQPLVQYIALPDGTQYKFAYEPTPSGASCTPLQGSTSCVTGRLASVTIPTGGEIEYSYSGGPSGSGIEIDGTTAGLTRMLTPGGTWTYARTTTPTPPTTTVTDPAGNNTVIDFGGVYETQRQTYQGAISSQLCSQSATNNCLLSTVITCYNGNSPASNCPTGVPQLPITERTIYTYLPNSSGLQSSTDIHYDGSGLGTVLEVATWGYGSGQLGNLLSQTYIVYGSYSGGSCSALGNNISNEPCTVTVEDGSSNVLSKTTYTYDQGTPQPTSGTPQHVAVTGSRGNATTVTLWSSSSASLSKTFTYYDTGNVYQATDVNGATTTYSFGGCGNSFLTSVTLPITVGGSALSASTTWNCTGGVALTGTDLNGNTTTTDYSDPYFWRPASVVAPYTSTGTTTTSFTYSPYNSASSTLANEDIATLFNGGASIVEQLATVNAFGQLVYSQQHEGPGSSYNWDATQTNYDAFLRAYQATMPCVTSSTTYTAGGSGPCSTSATTTTSFDALGRVSGTTDGGSGYVSYAFTENDVLQTAGPPPSGENLKEKQLEYDALGRLTKVCELTTMTGYGVCAMQSSSPNGYLTTYAYAVNSSGYPTMTVTQNAQASSGKQTRVYTYDLLGRLISEQNPENGTTTYTYDSDSSGTCSGPYYGDLVRLVDAKGNNICYKYDALHRMTSITYPSGPDAANTPAKTLVYDAATYNGTAMANAKGQLAEAYTGSSSSKTTDEFFSYSVRGEMTDSWECTPHSGTNGCASVSNYYHVTAGFWENGALKTLSSNISGLLTESYGVDGMGRTNAVNEVSGQTLVSNTSYNLSTFTYGVTFGSGDSDTFYVDPNTGRQTKYVFSVNGATDTGQTNWNANWSLASLQITDNVQGTNDTQMCNYTHDDLARIASVNCKNGSTNLWNQNFTYDAFGNISKTVPGGGTGITFPGYTPSQAYSPSTNWLTTASGCSPAYDNNGQMTYDCTHNYTWDVEGKLHSVDATRTLTHDALGRMVEIYNGSVYTQIVYGTAGNKFATMNGQTLVKAFIPLPAATAVYTSSGLSYYRHADHLGSSRLATTPKQAMYSSTAYAPYGEPYAQAGTTDLSFTGQDTDTIPVTTNGTIPAMYDFAARKFAPVQGRWLSPDPAGVGAADPGSPQSWNRYAYVMNNPMALIDPLGLDCVYVYDDGTTWTVTGDCYDSGDNGYYVDGDVGCVGYNCPQINWDPSTGQLSFGYSFSCGSFCVGVGKVGDNDAASSGTSAFDDPVVTPAGISVPGPPTGAPTAANQQPTKTHCLGQALKQNGISFTLDVVGAIPAFGNLVHAGAAAGRIIDGVVAYGGGAYGVATGLKDESPVGAASTGLSLGLTLAGTALGEGAKAIPVAGNVLSGLTGLYDAYQGYKTYQQCMAGGG